MEGGRRKPLEIEDIPPELRRGMVTIRDGSRRAGDDETLDIGVRRTSGLYRGGA